MKPHDMTAVRDREYRLFYRVFGCEHCRRKLCRERWVNEAIERLRKKLGER